MAASDYQRRLLAVHEGGHLAATLRLAQPVDCAMIKKDATRGHVMYRHATSPFGGATAGVITAAGPIAEFVFRRGRRAGDPWQAVSASQAGAEARQLVEHCDRLVMKWPTIFGHDPEQAARYMAAMADETLYYSTPLVTHLATELRRAGRLERKQIYQLFKHHKLPKQPRAVLRCGWQLT